MTEFSVAEVYTTIDSEGVCGETFKNAFDAMEKYPSAKIVPAYCIVDTENGMSISLFGSKNLFLTFAEAQDEMFRMEMETQDSESNLIKILVVEPMKKPELIVCPNNLKELRLIIGDKDSLIDVHGMDNYYLDSIAKHILIVGNDEAKMHNMRGNRKVPGDIIAGIFFLCGENVKNQDFCSLTEK